MNQFILYLALSLALVCFLWVSFLLWYLNQKRMRAFGGGMGLGLFLVSIPEHNFQKDDARSGEELKTFLSQMEQFLSGLGMLHRKGFSEKLWGAPAFTFEIASHNKGSEIFFYIAFPRVYETLLKNQLQGSFPDAKIERVQDYNIFNSAGATAGAVAVSAYSELLPLRTYQKLGSDPLEIITSSFSKIKEFGEGAAIQIILRASKRGEDLKKRAHSAAKKIKEGESKKEALGKFGIAKELGSFFTDTKSKEKSKPVSYDEDTAKLFEEKAQKIVFEANIRILASAKTAAEADAILKSASAVFLQFANPEGNSLKVKELGGAKLRNLVEQFSFRLFDEKNAILLNVEEIASIYHFPFTKKAAPAVRILKARESAPPVNLPKEGVLLGKNRFRGEEKDVRIKTDDRRRHFYTIGQTGTGKSTVLQKMAIQDIQNGEGVAVIDPHGDLIDRILEHVPRERADDVVYFDPGDVAHPIGLNMLEFDPRFPEQRSLIVNELLEIFNKLFNMTIAGGPQFEQYFRNATLLVMEDPESGNTLFDVERIFGDKSFRDYKLSRSKNIVVETFWRQIAERTSGEQSLSNMAAYILSKFDTFLSNEIMRPIMLQEHSAFNIRNIMDERKILLLNLSKGKLGELNSSLLGLIMVGKILLAALSRVDTPEGERKDFYLYIDEFQNVTTKSIATILSEARKYKLNLTIAHQFIGQLEEDIKKAVFGNVGSICSFRIGPDDAEYMEKQFAPVFSAQDLLNIDNLNAYLKLLIDGQTSKPFNLFVPFPPAGASQTANYIKELSRKKYSRPREEVEEEIRKKHQEL